MYCQGDDLVWWAFSSATSTVAVLNNDTVLGPVGQRTLFSIKVYHCVNIRRYIAIGHEDERLILPITDFHLFSRMRSSKAANLAKLEAASKAEAEAKKKKEEDAAKLKSANLTKLAAAAKAEAEAKKKEEEEAKRKAVNLAKFEAATAEAKKKEEKKEEEEDKEEKKLEDLRLLAGSAA
jgi:hypothetical protein